MSSKNRKTRKKTKKRKTRWTTQLKRTKMTITKTVWISWMMKIEMR